MRVTIEIDSSSELEKLSEFFKVFDINTVNVVPSNEIAVTKGDKSIDPKSLFGIWSKNPKTITDIRKTAWERKSTDK